MIPSLLSLASLFCLVWLKCAVADLIEHRRKLKRSGLL